MHPVEPPRVGRSLLLQLCALTAVALASERPWARKEPPPEPQKVEPQKEERRLRVVHLAPPPAARPVPPPEPAPAARQAPAPSAAKAAPPPPAARIRPAPAAAMASAKPAPAPARPAQARIAADSTAVQGVRLRVLIPRSAVDLAAHLRNSGGCLVVSRLEGTSAEVVSVLALQGGRAVEVEGPPCSGVPRLVRDEALNGALGDPLGRARAKAPGQDLVLQVLLTGRLAFAARAALLQRFGAVPEEEMGRRAAEAGYQLTCFAEPQGAVRCQ